MAVKLPVKQEISRIEEVTVDETPTEFVEFEQAPAFETLEPRKLAPFPAKMLRANQEHLFWDWVKELTSDDDSHILIYCYRLFPVIDRQKVDPRASKNIDKYGSELSRELLIKGNSGDHPGHGSGRYQFLVADSNKAVAGRGGQIGKAEVLVNDPEYPPVFRLDELDVNARENKTLVDRLVAEGKLTPQGTIMNPTTGGGDNAALIGLLTQLINKQTNQPITPRDTAMDQVAGMFTKTHETAMNMLKDQVKSDDPDKLVKMLALLKEMFPKPDSGNNEMMVLLIKMMMDAQARSETMMMKMFEQKTQVVPQDDPFDKELDRVIKIKELFGDNGGGREAKKSLAELAIEHGAPLLGKVLDTVQGFVNIKNYAAGMAKQPQANPQQPVEQIPMAVAAPESPQEQSKPENVVEMPQTPVDQLAGLIAGPVGPLVLDALKRGLPGSEFAASLEGMFGTLQYDQIASLGKETIIEAMKRVPQFWNQIVPETLEQFVDDFIDYGKGEEEG